MASAPAAAPSGSALPYRHRQRSSTLPLVCGIVLFATLVPLAGVQPLEPITASALVFVTVVLLVVAAVFSSLLIEVDLRELRATFGPGLRVKRMPVSAIADAEPVRNRWWYGWGIRITPVGMIYNVAGLSAVEVRLVNGRSFRLGTDQPERLTGAIRAALHANSSSPPVT